MYVIIRIRKCQYICPVFFFVLMKYTTNMLVLKQIVLYFEQSLYIARFSNFLLLLLLVVVVLNRPMELIGKGGALTISRYI